MRRFQWAEGHKEVIQEVLALHRIFELHQMDMFRESTSTVGSSDYHWVREIDRLCAAVQASWGPFSLEFGQLGAIRGSVHLVTAAGVLEPGQRKVAWEVVAVLDAFRHHADAWHRDGAGRCVPGHVIEQAGTPKYVGWFSLERAWRWAPELAGKSPEEVCGALHEELKGHLGKLKSNTSPYNVLRPRGETILESVIWNAIEVIESESCSWLERMARTDLCMEVRDISGQVHDQVLIIDEMICRGHWDDHARARIAGDSRFVNAIEKIRTLIDWEACEHLKDWMDQAPAADAAA
jgi:hypothetical protein